MAAVGFDTTDRNIRALQFDSTELEHSREEFIKQWRDGHFEVRTFQEALGLNGVQGFNGKVLSKSTLSKFDTKHIADAGDRSFQISRPHLMIPESAPSTLMRIT